MNSTLDKSLEGISVIEKIDNTADLEESLSKCIKDLSSSSFNSKSTPIKPTTPKSKQSEQQRLSSKKRSSKQQQQQQQQEATPIIKPILKSSKLKIDEMKAKIAKIFEDNDQLVNSLNDLQNKNDNEIKMAYSTGKLLYEKQIETIYEERAEMINRLNDKYNYDLFKLKDLMKDNNDNDNNTIKIIYDSLVNDKQKEKEEIDKEFNRRRNEVKLNYKESTCALNDFTIDDRSFIYKNELFEHIKERINEVVSPDKKRVSILTEVNYIYNQ